MRILFVGHRDPKHPAAGGAEEYVFQIAKRLAAKGYDVTILAERPDGLPATEVLDGVKIVRKGGFATLHLYAPLYVSRHEYDVVVDNVAHVFPFASPLFTKARTVAIIHHINGPAIRKVMPLPLAPAGALAEKMHPKIYKIIVAPSRFTKEELVKLGAREEAVHVVPPGVDHEIYRPGPKAEKPTIVWINRFVRYKNPDHAIKAFALVKKQVPDAHMIMIGGGPLLQKTQQLAQRLGLDIEFTGRVALEKKVEYLQRAWVCLYTSEIEGFGLVTLEAAASGTPCVGYAVGGLREGIKDGETGYLVSKGDITRLANIVTRILIDRQLLDKLSRNSIEYAKKYSWDTSAERFESILSTQLASDP
ncbi:glycosyltransferase family 4 protein [Pyrobaculum sp. 3827-6]|uniref:glycosyltransferase family 4 protein n=1 Tax=Pyrobaculum sp. 3827-6 TaxID=2983604 RepID=UPI0021D7F277|nr:glycosyltransferase family 4 protein [Pyrobaculum sp. 3827-6]MCU7787788.1 glycosyltransferase family 4 protein [Pyrobaculum sp. 3827-6]